MMSAAHMEVYIEWEPSVSYNVGDCVYVPLKKHYFLYKCLFDHKSNVIGKATSSSPFWEIQGHTSNKPDACVHRNFLWISGILGPHNLEYPLINTWNVMMRMVTG